jgi:aspartyl-tRNA(Asn)/glutamyl-tRNA(Gln) amidotransferase subunit A
MHFGYRTDEKSMLAELAAERKRLEVAGDQAGLENVDTALVRMYRRSRVEGFGAEVKRRIMLGTYALSAGYYDAYYLKALKVRRLIRQDFDRAFEKVDLIAGPITAAPAFKLGEMEGDPLAMYLVDLYTVSANLAGLPGIGCAARECTKRQPIGTSNGRRFDNDEFCHRDHRGHREAKLIPSRCSLCSLWLIDCFV